MAQQAKAVDVQKQGIYVKKGTHQAPGRNSRNTRHPVTIIYGRRFPKSYREYGHSIFASMCIVGLLGVAAFAALPLILTARHLDQQFLNNSPNPPAGCSTQQ